MRIPLRGITPSLNASVATALCVYEVARRNWMKDIHGQAPSPPIVRPRTAPDEEPESTPLDSASDVESETTQEAAVQESDPIEINLSASASASAEAAEILFDESIQLSN